MTMAIDAGRPAQSRRRLFAVLGGLYLAQAIPGYLLSAAMPPILRDQGVTRTTIGLLSYLMLPLVLKFLWAPLVDRWRPLARAHRAAWVIMTQAGMVAAISSLALIHPADPDFMPWFLAIAFLIVMLLATQDIATDGYAAKSLTARDRPIGNAIQGGAFALGIVIGGTASLVVYDSSGWVPMIGFAVVVSLVPIVAALAMREGAEPEVTLRRRPSLLAFLARPEARRILVIALLYRASEGLVKAMEGSYLVDHGVSLEIIGYLSGVAAAIAGLLGSGLAALLIIRLGLTRVLNLLGGLRTACFLLLALHAAGHVSGEIAMFAPIALQTMIRYMELVALYSLFMSVASSEQPGTDFTILACAKLAVYVVGSSLAGLLADRLGYSVLFALATLVSAATVLATWPLVRRLSPEH